MIGLNRRRMMGKEALTPIERLKQLGCLMWFPLGSVNGNNDVIGGRTIVVDTANTITHSNTTYSQFNFTLYRIGHIDISDLTSDDFVDGNFTTFFQARRHVTPSFRGFASAFKVNTSYIASGWNESGTANTSNWTNDSFNEGVLVRYKNGNRECYGNQVMFNNNPSSYPDIWDYSTIDIIGYNSNNKRLYVKNFLLFNRALTVSEIAEVHQIIS